MVNSGRLIHEPYRGSFRVGSRYPFVLVYRFSTKDGKIFKGECYSFNTKYVLKLWIKRRNLPVQYLVENPECSRIYGTFANPFPSWLFLIPGFFLLVGFIMFVWWFSKGISIRGLLTSGEAHKARVSSIEPVLYVNPHPMKITWQVLDPMPLQETVGSCWLPRNSKLVKIIHVNDIIWVICDPFKGNCFPWIFYTED